jgi:hypothetical protein
VIQISAGLRLLGGELLALAFAGQYFRPLGAILDAVLEWSEVCRLWLRVILPAWP